MSSRARALAVLIAVLLAGCLFGVAGLHFWERKLQADRNYLSSPRDSGRPNTLVERLHLTSDQQAQLKVILEDSRREINAGRAELERKMDAIRTGTNGKIAAMLNEEQKKRFEEYLKEVESRGGGGGRRGGRGGRPQGH